jgi:hypothetical protein
MDRPRLLPGQAEIVEQPEHPVLGIGDAEAHLDDPTQILGPPAAHAVALRVGTPQHQGLERRQLAVIEPGWAAAPGPIAQAFDALGVEPDHPVAQRLAVHAGLARRPLAAHPVQHVRHAEQAARHPAIALLPGQATQFLSRHVVTDRYRCAHRFTSLHHHAAR